MKKLVNVQFMRGLAAGIVAIEHEIDSLSRQTDILSLGKTISWYPFLTIGVDIFFVISGFIMVYLIYGLGKTFNRLKFIKNRIIRIVPTYWLYTTIFLIFSVALSKYFRSTHPDTELIYVIKSYFFIPAKNLDGKILPLLGPGWTLSFEIFFYASICVFFNRQPLIMAFSVTLLFITLFICHNLFATDVMLQQITSAFLFEFVFGMFIGILFLSDFIMPHYAPWIVALSAVALVATTFRAVCHNDIERVIYWGIPSALAVFAAIFIEGKGILLRPRLFVLIGNSSYTIYLTNQLVEPPVNRILIFLGVPVLFILPIAVVFAIGVGHILYLRIESPVMRFFKPKQRAGEARAFSE